MSDAGYRMLGGMGMTQGDVMGREWEVQTVGKSQEWIIHVEYCQYFIITVNGK